MASELGEIFTGTCPESPTVILLGPSIPPVNPGNSETTPRTFMSRADVLLSTVWTPGLIEITSPASYVVLAEAAVKYSAKSVPAVVYTTAALPLPLIFPKRRPSPLMKLINRPLAPGFVALTVPNLTINPTTLALEDTLLVFYIYALAVDALSLTVSFQLGVSVPIPTLPLAARSKMTFPLLNVRKTRLLLSNDSPVSIVSGPFDLIFELT